MKASELKELGLAELEGKVRELNEQAFKLRMQKATGQLENPLRVREVRRDLARILTVIGEKQRVRRQGE